MVLPVQAGRHIVRNGDSGLVAAAATALNRIGNRGLGEFLLLHRRTGAVFGVQNGALIGEQGLVGRNILFALQILRAVSAGIGFRGGQLDGIGQLDRRELGDILIDGPDKLVLGRIIVHLEAIVAIAQSTGIVTKVGHVAVRLGFQLRAADGQALDTIKVKLLTDGVGHGGTGTDSVENVLGDCVKVHLTCNFR